MGLGPLLLEWFSTQFIAERKYVCADGERNHFGMRSPPRLMTSLQRATRNVYWAQMDPIMCVIMSSSDSDLHTFLLKAQMGPGF